MTLATYPCAACGHKFFVVFKCEDGKERCHECKKPSTVMVTHPMSHKTATPLSASFATTPGPKQGAPYVSPYGSKAKGGAAYPTRRGRLQTLTAIEAQIQQRIATLKAGAAWESDVPVLNRIRAYETSIQIVRAYHELDDAGQPRGELP